MTESPLFDGLRNPGAKNKILDGIGKKGLLRIIVVNMGNIPGLDFRMVEYIVEDVGILLLGLYLIEIGRIAYAPKAEIETGLGQSPMVQAGVGRHDDMDPITPLGYLSGNVPNHIPHPPGLAVYQGIVFCCYKKKVVHAGNCSRGLVPVNLTKVCYHSKKKPSHIWKGP